MLRAAAVGTLLDVRRFPGSRRHPQFGQDALAASLAEDGIDYEWHGETLGGRRTSRAQASGSGSAGRSAASPRAGSRHTALREAAFAGYADHMDSPPFRAAVESLAERSAAGERLAVMCAETLWWRCHRSFIADALVMRGTEVTHLLRPGETQRHRPHTTARRGEDGWPVYDVPDTLL